MAEGYQNFSANYNVPANPKIWKNLWNHSTIPKIDMFSWTLTHKKILTGENLEKKGFAGPFRCPLCAVDAENISHLFFNCSFATAVWNEVLNGWGMNINLPNSIQDCFLDWDTHYNGELLNKNGLRACWMKIPKLICWYIWNERNLRIFQNKSHPAWKIAAKVEAMLGEIVNNSKIPSNKGKLNANEESWLKRLNIKMVRDEVARPLEKWEIIMVDSQFENWLKERKIFKLFFDGASKGNPGKAGGGGVIIEPGGEIMMEYYWNIGQNSNNMAEAYGLWQGIKQLQKEGVEEVMVFGDSRLVIQAMNGGGSDKNEGIARLIKRIKAKARRFKKVTFHHILRELNDRADKAANKSIRIGQNDLVVNSILGFDIPP